MAWCLQLLSNPFGSGIKYLRHWVHLSHCYQITWSYSAYSKWTRNSIGNLVVKLERKKSFFYRTLPSEGRPRNYLWVIWKLSADSPMITSYYQFIINHTHWLCVITADTKFSFYFLLIKWNSNKNSHLTFISPQGRGKLGFVLAGSHFWIDLLQLKHNNKCVSW